MTQSSGSESFELVWHVQDQLNRTTAKFEIMQESFINRTFNCSQLELGVVKARAFINCTFPNLVQLRLNRADRRSFVQCKFPRIEYHRQITLSQQLEDVFVKCVFKDNVSLPREDAIIQHEELVVLERYNSPELADMDKDAIPIPPDNPDENTPLEKSLGQSTLGKSTLGKDSPNQSILEKSNLEKSTPGKDSLGQSTLEKSTLEKSALGKDSLTQSALGGSILERSTLGKDSLDQRTPVESPLDDNHEVPHDLPPPQDELSETEVSEQSRTEVSDDEPEDEEPQPINPTESYSESLSVSREGKLKFKPNIQHDEEDRPSVFSLAGKMVVLGLKTVFQK